jgi:urate oxidase
MSVLTHNAYGKSQICLTRITRHADRHDVKVLCIAIQLEGDFAASYLHGDNARVIPTDTMKNTVYVFAKKQGIGAIEQFGEIVAQHFLDTYAHVAQACISLEEQPWQRLSIDGQESPFAFSGTAGEKRTSTVTLTRQSKRVESGLEGLALLKTTESAFRGFLRDEYTTLRETDDRIFATLLTARWLYREGPIDWDRGHAAVRQMLLRVFAGHKSLSVQQTLYAMAKAALEAAPEVEQITLEMPNRHHLLVDLRPFGLENPNEIFVATEEPYGLIKGTIRRGEPRA